MHVCVCVCVCVCVHVCVHACTYAWCVCMCVDMCACVCACVWRKRSEYAVCICTNYSSPLFQTLIHSVRLISPHQVYSLGSEVAEDGSGTTVTSELRVTDVIESHSGLVECLVTQHAAEDGMALLSRVAHLTVLRKWRGVWQFLKGAPSPRLSFHQTFPYSTTKHSFTDHQDS